MSYPGRLESHSDSVVASTTTITVKSDQVRVTGTTNIATINVPINNINTVIYVIPTSGTVSTVTTGNIAVAVAMAVNRVTVFVYNNVTKKWHPGAIS